jgi:NAD(P)-dependent dehydrogenase (short-subunit alcohol dehydrogenase family)
VRLERAGTVPLDLTHRTALVTGASSGIGFAIAQRLSEAGADVIINGRDADRLASATATLNRGSGEPVRGIVADATTQDGAEHLAADAGHLDILVNNLGIFEAVPPLEISDEQWSTMFTVNVLAPARLTRMLLPAMSAKRWGRVINIASDSAIVTPAEMIHYGMSKTALLAVTRGFAKAAAGTGVTVNSVIAGPTHTPGVETFVRQLVGDELDWESAQREFMRLHRPQSLLGRLLEPIEIANMVLYLASPLASGTTGGALRVDGGFVDSILP